MRDQTEHLQAEDQLKRFEHRIIVSVTRHFDDVKVLEENLQEYVQDLGFDKIDKAKICFMLGELRYKAEPLVKAWCERNGYACLTFTPKWADVDIEGSVIRYKNGKAYNAMAIYWLNEEMAEFANYLITFYDGVSSDTKDLIQRMSERLNPCRAVLVHIESDEEKNHGGQS